MTDPHDLHLQILGGRVTLSFDHAEAFGVTQSLWAPFVVDGQSSSADLTVAGGPGEEFLLEREGQLIERTTDPWTLFLRMKVEITASALAQRPDLVVVHAAGVVERNDAALLLVGMAGAGKTTLSTDLVARGMSFMGDDLIAVEPSTLMALPLPRPPAYKGLVHTQADFAAAWASPDWLITTGPFMVPATALGPLPRDPVRVGRVVFPRYQAGSSGTARRLSPAEAVAALGEETHALNVSDLSVLLRLCRAVEITKLEYSTTEQAVQLLT